MNALPRLLVSALISVFAASALATIDPAGGSVQRIHGDPAARLTPMAVLVLEALREQERAYSLSNGRKLRVSVSGQHVQLHYRNRPVKRLQLDEQGRFVSVDGLFVLAFEADERGEPTRISLAAPVGWL